MCTKRYISDLHFGHENCLAFDNRPFPTLNIMNAELVKRWNEVVQPGDLTYILGDMFWCKQKDALPILDLLNGSKILIRGNHDRSNSGEFTRKFAKITDYLEVEDGDKKIVLCHYPIVCYKNHYYGWYHFYGHVHNSFEYNMMEYNRRLMRDLYDKPCEMYNVGAMMPWMDYTPRTADEILNGYKKQAE